MEFTGIIKYEEIRENMKKPFRKLGYFSYERIFSITIFKMALINFG
jgi:hypothetical protein